MEFKDSLLFASLIQVPRITVKQESEYWKQGIYTLEDLANHTEEQLSFFPSSQSIEIKQLIDDAGSNIDAIAKMFDKKSGKKDFYRIAYSIPEYVMFLDIETTGLSPFYHYVTLIGWMLNGKYGCWIAGTDPTDFFDAYRNAKMLVTFNGVKFDCKFLHTLFPNLNIEEKLNLDLMHFCRKYGLKKGQKNIEQALGFHRPNSVIDCAGKEAIALWYKFIFGDDEALQLLIEYNFYDISGMSFILDEVFFKQIYGKEFPKICKVKRFYDSRRKNHISYSKRIMASIRKHISEKNFDIDLLKTSATKRIVGIDLAGVINKSNHTGICLLVGNQASTRVVQYDEEIVQYIVEARADLVSIDAPLSLPQGRTSVYNDDPMRKVAGITRHSERILYSRGVKSYPALINSMQELTKRGIYLSQQLRKMGYPVIECFPGAAQDILQLPRKRTDENLLKAGLIRLGIRGDFQDRKVIHDELDAITAAIVGRFFIDSYYEPIGIPEENDMIVPSRIEMKSPFHIVIGLTGHIAAGKTTAAAHIERKGFAYYRYSQVIADVLKSRDIEVNRDSLQQAGGQLFDFSGQYDLNRQVEERLKGNLQVVIDGMRHYEDYTYWKEKSFTKFYLLYIEADEDICIARYKKDDYQKVDQHHVEQEIDELRVYADAVIENDGTLEDLYAKIDAFMKSINLYKD